MEKEKESTSSDESTTDSDSHRASDSDSDLRAKRPLTEKQALRYVELDGYNLLKVKTWNYYRCNVLSHEPSVLEKFARVSDREELKLLARKYAPPSTCGPSEIRSNRKTAQNKKSRFWNLLMEFNSMVLRGDLPFYVKESPHSGVGLFLREDLTVRSDGRLLSDHLFGLLVPLEKTEYDKLLGRHPSLYEIYDRHYYILCGPLALVNHSCSSDVFLTASTGEYVYCKYKGARKTKKLAAGEELLICYSGENTFRCICRECR